MGLLHLCLNMEGLGKPEVASVELQGNCSTGSGDCPKVESEVIFSSLVVASICFLPKHWTAPQVCLPHLGKFLEFPHQ